jgi:hypothetical protein
VLCALFLNLSIIILLRIAAIFLSNVTSPDTELILAVFQGHTEWELVPLLLECLFMLAVLVLLIDGQRVCHVRPYLSEKAHCTAISSD